MNLPTLLDYLGAEKAPDPLEELGLEPCPTCRDGMIPMTGGAVKVCPSCRGARFVARKERGVNE